MYTLPRTEARGDGVACFVKEGIEVLDREVQLNVTSELTSVIRRVTTRKIGEHSCVRKTFILMAMVAAPTGWKEWPCSVASGDPATTLAVGWTARPSGILA